MNNLSEKNFQLIVKYGPVVLGACILLNVWVVMRYREVYRDAIGAEVQLQRMVAGDRILQGLLQDFSARGTTDPHIAQILREAQSANVAGGTAAGQRIQH